MKKLIHLGCIALILIGIGLIAYTCLPHRPTAAAKSGGQFSDFPIGAARLITLGDQRKAFDGLTPREQVDQIRDWLLFVATSSAGLTAKEINESLFDLPPIRHGYMKSVANFEYGDTRSCYIGNGQVVALIPADNSDERTDRLARIVDEQRKNLGEKPKKLIVFEYDLKLAERPAEQTASLTRREPVDVTNLYTLSAGYYEAQVKTLSDLNHFMEKVDDLTYVSVKDGLTLGGRKVKGHSYRGIRVEDIAALYKSDEEIHAGKKALDERIDEYNARWGNRSTLNPSEEVERQSERAAINDSMMQASKVSSSGFSLDPAYDYSALLAKFNSTIAPQINKILTEDELANASSLQERSLSQLRGPPVPDSVALRVQKAREGLEQHNVDPLFVLLRDVKSSGERGAAFVAETQILLTNKDFAFQAARYIGQLKGTETGMVLFYTDLLAKLWAINFQNNFPSGYIDEFRPLTAVTVPALYRGESEELSRTRLWFGPRDTGFQISDKAQEMLFARTSTRIYAASSNSLRPGVESAPSAESAAFLGWWDSHYDEVARFEPEYERLNQIMKWSLAVNWLNSKDKGSILSFLQGVDAARGYWFSDWVKQRSLRFQAWDRIGFYPRGSKDSDTEVLPRLESQKFRQFGKERWFVGGVSLANEDTLAARASLSGETKVELPLRRSNLDYAASESSPSTLKTLDGATYKFAAPSTQEATTTIIAESGARLSGAYGDVLNASIERTILRSNDGLNIRTQIGSVPYGELSIAKSENGFRVGWLSRDMDAGMMLGRRLSSTPAPAKMLALDPSVDVAISLPGESEYLVKLAGSERWLRASRGNNTGNFSARVSGFGEHAQTYDLQWVKNEDVSAALGNGRTLRFYKIENTENGYAVEIGTPDTMGERFVIEHEGVSIQGTLDPVTRDLTFAYDELPQSVRDNPGLLRRLVSEAKPSAGNNHYSIGPFNKSTLLEQVDGGDYRTIARQMVKSPDQFKAELDIYLQTNLAQTQALMRNEQFEIASQRLDELIQIYGPREDLSLYKTLSDLSIPRSTRNTLTELVTRGNRPTLIEEINTQLKSRLVLKQPGENLSFIRDGNDVALRYDVKNLSDSKPLTETDLQQARALIYVEDSPGLNNLDWQISPQRTLQAAMASELQGKVIKLPRGDVAHFRPVVIFDQQSGVKFKAANTGGGGTGFRKPRVFRMDFKVGGSGTGGFPPNTRVYGLPLGRCVDDDDQPTNGDDKDCDHDDDNSIVILVIKK